jgi:hypothetical protein
VDREQLRAKIMAAAYAAAAELGTNGAVRLLEEAIRDLTDAQWAGPANR